MAKIFISYAHSDGAEAAEQLLHELRERHDVWLDRERLNGGASWSKTIEDEIDSREIVLALLSKKSDSSIVCRGEHLRAGRKGKRVIPIRLQADANIPIYLEPLHYLEYAASEFSSLHAAIEGAGSDAKLKPDYRHTDYQTVPRLPHELVDRPVELDNLRKLLISDFGNRRVAVVALKAMGGIGKTVLAQIAGHDGAIQDAFPDGVIWATIGENPTNAWLMEQLREVGKRLGDRMDRYDSLTGCRNQLNTILREKSALLILDDVWHAPHANHFLADSPKSRVLVTTREKSVATALSAKTLSLNPLDDGQSRELLTLWASEGIDKLPPAANTVMDRCGRLPLALAMCGAMVRDGYSWSSVADHLGRVGYEFAGYPHQELFAAISVSVERLGEPLRTCYTDLAVFPPDVRIPESALPALWAIEKEEADRALLRLAGASLCTRDGETVALHDVQHAWCAAEVQKGCLSREGLAAMQGAIRLSAHVLVCDSQALPTQLIGRLMGEESHSVQALLQRLRSNAEGVWLEPRTPSLTPAGGPLLRTLEGHSSRVTAVAVTPDGQRTVSASHDTTLKIWDLASGQELRTLEGHSRAVNAVAVTPDGQRAVSASYDYTLKIWDLPSGRDLCTMEGHSKWVNAVTVAPDGQRAVSASHDQTLKIWDLASGQELRTLEGHSRAVNAVAVTPDGQRAISASDDNTLKIWDLPSGQELGTLEGHSRAVNAVAVTPDGQRVVSASQDQTLKIWDLASGQELRTLERHSQSVNAVAVTADGQRAVSASSDNTLKIWDLASGQELRTLKGHSGPVTAVSVTPDGKRAVSASFDRTLKIWDLTSGRELPTLEGHSNQVTAVVVAPDGRRAVSCSWDRALKIWDLASGQKLRTMEGHSGSVAFTSDGQWAVSATPDNALKIWEVASGEELRTLEGHSDSVRAVAVTPDGQRAVSASSDNTLKIWDLASGQKLRTLKGHSDSVRAVALTADGQRAVSASWDNTLKIWDLASGQELRTLNGHSRFVNAVAVTADGRRAISASSDNTLKIWDLASGQELRTLEGHSSSVTAAALTSDGQRAVSGSYDKTVKVWDLVSGQCLATFNADGAILAVAIASRSYMVVAGDALGRIHFLTVHGLSL